jgi:GTP cyclohydrolase-4
MAKLPPDVQSQKPMFGLSVDKVGLVSVIKEIVFNDSPRPYNLVASFDVFTDLPATQRGMHMSRPGEAIMDIIENASAIPIKTFEALCAEISKRTLEVSESSSYAETRLRGRMVLKSRSKINNRLVSEPVRVFSSARVIRDTGSTIHSVGVSVIGMTVCPCAKELTEDYSRDMIGDALKGFGVSEKNVDELVKLIPVASHVQRGEGKILATGVKPGVLDIYDLVDIIEESMSGPTQDVLKRTDEASLVRIAFSRPRFVEDVVRNMAFLLAKKYAGKIEDSALFLLSQRNYESIHKHDVKAEIRVSMKQLINKFSDVQ